MRCEDARAGLLAGLDDAAVREHVETCPACRSLAAELAGVRRTLDDAAAWEEPSPELEEQVVTLIRTRTPPAGGAGTRLRVIAGSIAVAAVVLLVTLVATRAPSPDWEVPIGGTDLATDAAGVVRGWNEPGGTRVVLDVDGLPAAPAGHVYEFWFSDGPVHVSAGTFAAPVGVELWVGVSRAEFPRLWVTLEPIDEDESPSPRTVLDTG